MRLYEIEVWHPGMLDALVEAHRERWTLEHELLRTIGEQTNAVYRQLFRSATDEHTQQPEPIEIRRPGDKPRWVQQMTQLAASEGG